MKGKKKYFIVRMTSPTMGPGAAMRNFILVASWAEKEGWIPVLDWEYGATFLEGKLGEDNFQEYFFENQQSIDDILNDNEILVGTINYVDVYDKDNKFICENIKSAYCMPDIAYEKEYFHQFNFYLKKYFPIKRQLIEECEKLYGDILKRREKTIAIMMRETFSKESNKYAEGTLMSNILKKHPMAISANEAVELVKRLMREWDCEYVFVASIMQTTKELFEREFGEKVQMVDRKRMTWEEYRNRTKEAVEYYSLEEKVFYPKEMQLERYRAYIQEIYIASKCGYLVGTPSTGVTLALSINDGEYIDKYITQDKNEVQITVKEG